MLLAHEDGSLVGAQVLPALFLPTTALCAAAAVRSNETTQSSGPSLLRLYALLDCLLRKL